MATRKKPRTHHIVVDLMTLLNNVKIYHWSTPVFSQHKTTDDLYASLTTLVDKFVETWIGVHPQTKRLQPFAIKINTYTSKTFVSMLKSTVASLGKHSLPPELTNIRDDILTEITKAIYLFTFE